jgi:uncharacterized protein YeaO (DUF488 family)
MRVIVAGGRDFNNYELVVKTLDRLLPKNEEVIIISGCANGADSLGEQYASDNGLLVERFPADWDKHGKAAGPIRNAQMAEVGDKLIAFWDGESRGTKNMIDTATKKGLEVTVIPTIGKLYLSSVSKIKDIPEGVIKLFIALAPIKDMDKYDLHHAKNLAPSRELLYDIKSKKITWKEYVLRFRREMLNMTMSLNNVQRHLDKGNSIALICYCGNYKQCHRGLFGHYFEEIGYEVVII